VTCQPIQPWVRPIEERINAAIAALEAVELAGEKITTPLDFGSVVWRAWGERGKPELVLLHGGSGSWGHWIANVLPLAESNRVLVPDIPGFGDSAVPPAPHAADDVARALRAGLDMVLDRTAITSPVFPSGR
jgi:2-hydroxy-6-oxonona-2,4-dienedioate hydrolase